jgi:tetratricopeptide (TPR) repeat protein
MCSATGFGSSGPAGNAWILSPRGNPSRCSKKEKKMKRLSLWLSLSALLVLAFVPAFAQNAPSEPTGKIHGQVINPTGQPQTTGTVNLSTDNGATFKYSFDVKSDGTFSGEAAPGTYSLIYRQPDTPKGQMVDEVTNVKIVAGQDIEQNDDMSRAEYVAKMSPEARKQLEELKKENSAAVQANSVIAHLNADLKVVAQDQKDVDDAGTTAQQQLGASASKSDVDAKANEIKTAKYTDIESLMTKDTTAKPDEALLWTKLAYAQAGLKKYDDALTSYKKAVDLETAAKKPRMEIIGLAQAGLGEVYARTGKVDDANTAYDAAAKADPTRAGLYLKNETIIFFQQGNGAAQGQAADKAIAVSPNDPILYYLKGNALVQNASVDPKTHEIVLPSGCAEAYQKYLQLAPNGQFAAEVTGILQSAGQKISSSYKAGKH